MTWRRALACLLVAAVAYVWAESGRLRRALPWRGPNGRCAR